MRAFDHSSTHRVCPQKCECIVPGAWQNCIYNSSLTLCRTQHARPRNSSDKIADWCDFRSSAAYAVHKSGFPVYLEALRAVRDGHEEPVSASVHMFHGRFPDLDRWTAAALDTYHFLPSLVVQKSGGHGNQDKSSTRSSREFRRRCAV